MESTTPTDASIEPTQSFRERNRTNTTKPGYPKNRDPKYLRTDKAALRAIAQMAVNVELFTIPLYMTAMYSIQGMHQVNIKNFDYYRGRVWPGSEPTCLTEDEKNNPNSKANEKAFNAIFGVFVQEMFHLEMAANLATAIGVTPSFTGSPLQGPDNGWTAYGPGKTVIPGIVDLKHTTGYGDLEVKLGPLDENSINLFCLIEQDDDDAKESIQSCKQCLYFPEAPFVNWEPGDDLPMFGSIGHMYECYEKYANITYTDKPNQTLFERMYLPPGNRREHMPQRRLFNNYNKQKETGGDEFPGVDTDFIKVNNPKKALRIAMDMMHAIVDQGEGHKKAGHGGDEVEVRPRYQPDEEVIAEKYPSYNDEGDTEPQATHACARAQYEKDTHFDRFVQIRKDLCRITTWADWHRDGNVWSEGRLVNDDYDPAHFSAEQKDALTQIPTPVEVAAAMNNLKTKRGNDGDRFDDFSRGAVGALYGVVRALNQYWRDTEYGMPLGAMRATGDRLSIIWAVYGETPDLSLGIGNPDCTDTLHNACQGLSLEAPGNACAAAEAYHTCKNANSCRTQGACGVVAPDCADPDPLAGPQEPCKELGENYTAPADNQCKTLAGCSVPISASQMLRVGADEASMNVYNFKRDASGQYEHIRLNDTVPFKTGDTVYNAAWEAYKKVMAARGVTVTDDDKPKADDMRTALIPN